MDRPFTHIRKTVMLVVLCTMPMLSSLAQENQRAIAMISDTQAPMWIEKVFLKSDHNEKATAILFEQIVKLKPQCLFILGDVTSWSAKEKKWHAMDGYLQACRASGIQVTALFGNHDVMGSVRKADANFTKRFPEAVPTGQYRIVDSIAFVMLNSNFKKMKSQEIEFQQKWYQKNLTELDSDKRVKLIVVSCHHPPYTNSKIVESSKPVQDRFVPLFLSTKKCRLFITGHAHAFEHFIQSGKDFFVIGGGGGIHQPLAQDRKDIQADYKPQFHFLMLTPGRGNLRIESYYLKNDFSGVEKKPILTLQVP